MLELGPQTSPSLQGQTGKCDCRYLCLEALKVPTKMIDLMRINRVYYVISKVDLQ